MKLILSSAGKESIRNTHLVLFVSFPGYSSFLEQIKKGSDILNNVGFSFVFIRTRQAILASPIHMGFCSNLSKFYSRFLSIIYQLCYITHSAKYRGRQNFVLFSILVRGQDGSKLRHFEANRLLDERKFMLVERAFLKKPLKSLHKSQSSLAA